MIRLLLLFLYLIMLDPVHAAQLPQSKHKEALYPATDPTPWARFCETYAGECSTPDDTTMVIRLDRYSLERLRQINYAVNNSITYQSDQQHWGVADQYDLPTDGRGDCEDYALLKRKQLIRAGFPARALLLTIVQWRGEGHALLTVVTDRGDFLLDMHTDRLLTYDDYDFKLTQRQDPQWLRHFKRFEEWHQ